MITFTFVLKIVVSALFIGGLYIVLGIASRSVHHPPMYRPARRRRRDP